MKYVHIILLCILIFSITDKTYADEVEDTLIWVRQNPNATSKNIETFFNKTITLSKNMDSTYKIIDTILDTYPKKTIPYVIFLYHAHISELKFDFNTAAQAYKTVYDKTNNTSYLIKSAINYFEAGKKNTTTRYLNIVKKSKPSVEIALLLSTIEATILLQNNQKKQALATLQKARFAYPREKFSSSFFYTLYFIAEELQNTTISNEAQQILANNFPYSIEMYLLNSARVNPLPLPSRILTLGSHLLSNLNNSINAIPSIKKNTNKTNEKKILNLPAAKISPPPKVGYQVGSFTNFKNAQDAYTYFYTLWHNVQLATLEPIIVKKNISNTIFYQVIFPFSDNIITYEEIVSSLHSESLEGFIVQQK